LLPLPKPNIIAKTMIMGVDSPAGSQSARHERTHIVRVRINVLTLPIISATRPAKKRPKKEPAFNMARI